MLSYINYFVIFFSKKDCISIVHVLLFKFVYNPLDDKDREAVLL